MTIGVFDGVHRGHAELIATAVKRAAELGLPAVVLSFDPHPSEVVRPGSHPAVLTTAERKAELLAALGVDALCVLPFTYELSQAGPATFVHDVLVDRLHAADVVVGRNFTFGHKAAGDVVELARLGDQFGFEVHPQALVAGDASTLSATFIRSCVAAGDVTAARAALGRPYRIDGLVVRGDRRGRTLGYPTANLYPERYAAVPADGVYAGRVVLLDQHGGTVDAPPLGAAAVSVGTNPTFDGRARRVEAFILDYDGDLYGERIGVEFEARLRGMQRYDSLEPLLAQMAQDVRDTRGLIV